MLCVQTYYDTGESCMEFFRFPMPISNPECKKYYGAREAAESLREELRRQAAVNPATEAEKNKADDAVTRLGMKLNKVIRNMSLFIGEH